MAKLGIFIEQKHGKVLPVGLELLSEVNKQLATREVEVVAVVITNTIDQANIDKIKNCGANRILIVENRLFENYDTHYYNQALGQVLKAEDFDVFLLGSTLVGRDLAPRLSAKVHTGLTADATILEFGGEANLDLFATRPALGGNIMATIVCPNHRPQMATIRPGVFSIYKTVKPNIIVQYQKFEQTAPSKVRRISATKLERSLVDLTGSKIIVAGGRGVATMFKQLQNVGDLIGGEVAASRAVVDAGFQARERLVGQTGTTVKPSVYLAMGISGAIQHVSGMDKSELIIAVNNDPEAMIFNLADVSIICDATKVIPYLQEYLQDMRNAQ